MEELLNTILEQKKRELLAKQQKYFIGIDTQDENNNAYCLSRDIGNGIYEVVLAKTIQDKKEFDEEVGNMVKYFDAVIVK